MVTIHKCLLTSGWWPDILDWEGNFFRALPCDVLTLHSFCIVWDLNKFHCLRVKKGEWINFNKRMEVILEAVFLAILHAVFGQLHSFPLAVSNSLSVGMLHQKYSSVSLLFSWVIYYNFLPKWHSIFICIWKRKVCNIRYQNVPHWNIVSLNSHGFMLHNLVFIMNNIFTYSLFSFFPKHRE